MDGFQKRLNSSVRLRLSFWLSLTILLTAIAAGVTSFVASFDEALRLQDDVLRQVASLVDRQHFEAPLSNEAERRAESEDDLRVTVQYLSTDGATDVSAAPLPLPSTLSEGFHTVSLPDDTYRVLVLRQADGRRLAVAQETDLRDEIARDSALHAVAPILVLVPVLLWLVSRLIRQMFEPIAAVADEINRRGEADLHPIAADPLPIEVRPFATAINRLLGRVGRSMQAQRRFVADAAHELRSPLTAVSLQAGRLGEADMSEQARERLRELRRGIDRSRALLDQLLAIARAQAGGEAPTAPVSVRGVFRRVLEDLLPLAQARSIDIGVEGEGDAHVIASEVDLTSLVRNLVDNAIRYTPVGGRVDLSVATGAEGVELQVLDTGPGIRPAERTRVFDPFYRVLGSEVLGSGLGLSIVKAIADRLGAQVTLDWGDEQACKGLRARVFFPG
ncbi:ATP-binding protein [Ideonella sp. YS5]|uniref:ATP-binding protein n=1 Tax=Ideonella sp. YS5 TaxID=3453714 RepID=UPI003EE93E31